MKTNAIGLTLVAGIVASMIFGGINTATAVAQQKDTIIFLLGSDPCEAKYDFYVNHVPDAYVTCSNDTTWQEAHIHYSGFEQSYKVIYVINTHVLSKEGGYAWWDGNGHGYAWSADFIEVVSHEKNHLDKQCLYTDDGFHGVGTCYYQHKQ